MDKFNINFFERKPDIVAKELLGNILVSDGIELLITETEAYGDQDDQASHARFGKTERSKIMFGESGTLYIYLIYGMYYLTNIITGKANEPGAVLLRQAQIIKGSEIVKSNILKHRKIKYDGKNLLKGPGIISAALNFSGIQNGVSLIKNNKIYIQNTKIIYKDHQIQTGTRIGIDYAGDSKDLPWRYTLNV